MIQANNTADRSERVRRKTLAMLSALVDEGKAAALPEAPPGLEQVRRKLQENTYQLLVVGEAKRGKSTLINALIGRNILPTDVDIATSQVFRICPADREAYRLRFEDDSQQEISAADLPRYGSQVVADRDGAARLHAMIRWIEIDLPVKFLPPNVRILDTPGLGALYAAHAQITHRFVPHADAVIFALDSQSPIGEPEIQFVEQLLSVTANIFFVQTKIDQFRKDAWQEVLRRNQEILHKRFAERLRDARVWPVSSTNLAKVAATNDPDYLQVSRYKELEAALQSFLFRVAGWDRAAVATVLARDYHAHARSALSRRLASLADEAAARPDARQWAARREQFATAWGESGLAHQQMRVQVRGAANEAGRGFTQVIQPNGGLEMEHRGKIDRLESAAQARDYAARLSEDIVAAVSQRWRRATEEFRSACTEALAPLWQANRQLDDLPAANPVLSMSSGQGGGLGGDHDKRKAALHAMASTMASPAAGATISLAVAVGAVFPPAAIAAVVLAVVGVGLVGAFRAWKGSAEKELKAAQEQLHKQLTALLLQIRQQFIGGEAGPHPDSLVDDYFRARVRELDHQVTEMVRQKLAEMDAEAARIEENARLDAPRREAMAEEVRRQLQQWDSMGDRIQDIQVELEALDRAWTASSPAPV